MTLGEKIRYIRKASGLSQEQLGEKLCVSRSAIAKWETGKGLPDIENLKVLSRLLGVTVDSLLEDSSQSDPPLIREPYRLSAYGRGCRKLRKDRMMRQRFPQGHICQLLGRPEVTQESIADSSRGLLTPTPFGSPEFIKSIRNLDRDFYLVEQPEGAYFVTVTDEHLEIRPFCQSTGEKSYRQGNWIFIRGSEIP